MAASYISVPRDLTKVKSKVMFNLTKRQLICFGMAAVIGVPSFFLLKSVTAVNTAVMGMMVIMMPFFFLAMYEKNGQPLEVILGHMIQAIFVRPKVRPYVTDNYYSALERQNLAEQKIREIQDRSLAELSVKKSGMRGQVNLAEGNLNGEPASCSAKQNKRNGGRQNCSAF